MILFVRITNFLPPFTANTSCGPHFFGSCLASATPLKDLHASPSVTQANSYRQMSPCQVLLLLFLFKHLIFFALDSFFISHQRPSSQLELLERQTLLQENRRIPFTSSLVSYFLANQYIKVFAPILDWSSIIDQNSFVYNTLIKPSATLTAQV